MRVQHKRIDKPLKNRVPLANITNQKMEGNNRNRYSEDELYKKEENFVKFHCFFTIF